MASKREVAAREQDARAWLAPRFPADQERTLYAVVRSVAKSGMSRTMSFYTIHDGRLAPVTHSVGALLGYRMVDVDGRMALRVEGCGMDMAFHVANSLSYALHGMDHPKAGYTIRSEWI